MTELISKYYTMPIQGTVINTEPLKGLDSDPICCVPFYELPDKPLILDPESNTLIPGIISYRVISYDLEKQTCLISLTASVDYHRWLKDRVKDMPELPSRIERL